MVTFWFEDADDPWVIDPTGAMTSGMPRMSELPGWEPIKVFSEKRDFDVVPRLPGAARLRALTKPRPRADTRGADEPMAPLAGRAARAPSGSPPGCCLPAAGDSRTPSAFRVALLTPGSIADGGWNAGAYEGLEAHPRSSSAPRCARSRRAPRPSSRRASATSPQRGFALVFGHGFEYQEAAAKVGAEFPETIFITTSGNTVRPNVAPMVFELEQATYLCGLPRARA